MRRVPGDDLVERQPVPLWEDQQRMVREPRRQLLVAADLLKGVLAVKVLPSAETR